MRAAVYVRVSSDKQAREGTIESQLRDVPAYCERQGWRVVEVYVDDGKSAASGKLAARDGLARLLADAAAGRFDLVAVADLDRLTRSEDLTERGAILGALQRAGVQVATTAGALLDLASGTGDLMAALGGAFAAEWLRKHRARIKAGKLTAIGRGRKPAGPTPYGYRYDRATGAWSVDADAAAIVREVFARVAAGEACPDLAEDFTIRAVPRPRGGGWSREAVWQIARREVYSTGRWTCDKARGLAVTVPTIVTPADHAAVQQAMVRHRKRGLVQTRHVYLLERLASCSRCGAAIGIASAARQPTRRGGERQVPARYVCCHRRRPAGERCTAPYHTTAAVDAALWAAITDLVLAPDLVERAVRGRRDADGTAGLHADAERARAELARLDRAEATLLERVTRITPAALDAQLERIAARRTAAAQQLAAAEQAAASRRVAVAATAGLDETLADLRQAMASDVTPAQRRELVRLLVAEVEIGAAALVAQLHLPSERVGLALAAGSSTAAPDNAGRLVIALPRPVPPPPDPRVAAAIARAAVPPPPYLTPARVTGGVVRSADGRQLELRCCAGCALTFWAKANSPNTAAHCSHACYTASGARARARRAA